MDVREKLVELLFKCTPKNIKLKWRGEKIEVAISQGNIADYLIAHGVTVRECGSWKYYHKQNKAVCTNCSFERDLDANFGKAITCPNCGAYMPQPPKGE